MKKMAKVVDEQNKHDRNYIPMSKDFDKSIAFKASVDLVLEEILALLVILNQYCTKADYN